MISAALLGCWPYLPLRVQQTFLPKFMTFAPPKTLFGWLSKTMFCSLQTVLFGTAAAESVAEHAWFNGLKAAVQSQTEYDLSIFNLKAHPALDDNHYDSIRQPCKSGPACSVAQQRSGVYFAPQTNPRMH